MSPSLAAGQSYVLVVENDPALRELFREALSGAGLEPVTVEDGLSALRCVEAAKPRAIVLDVDLPQRGGLDVQQELKGRVDSKHIPILLVGGGRTSRMSDSDVCLPKPVSGSDLIAAVQRCLRPVNWTARVSTVAVIALAGLASVRAMLTRLRAQQICGVGARRRGAIVASGQTRHKKDDYG